MTLKYVSEPLKQILSTSAIPDTWTYLAACYLPLVLHRLRTKLFRLETVYTQVLRFLLLFATPAYLFHSIMQISISPSRNKISSVSHKTAHQLFFGHNVVRLSWSTSTENSQKWKHPKTYPYFKLIPPPVPVTQPKW